MNSTLIIGATHGNEPIGVRALESLETTRRDFDWVIGNPRAYQANVRFTDTDLNRSGPGDSGSLLYEERRAAELIALSKQYQSVIDIHGTSKQTGLFTIVTNPSAANMVLAGRLAVQRIVIWPAITPELAGPISEFFPRGVEIECGPKESLETQKQLESVLNQYLDGNWESLEGKEVYEVFGQLTGDPEVELTEFQEVNVNGEVFTPLLIGSYKDRYGVTCYKLRRVR